MELTDLPAAQASGPAPFDSNSLARYLFAHGLIDAPVLAVVRLAGGQSKPTYRIALRAAPVRAADQAARPPDRFGSCH